MSATEYTVSRAYLGLQDSKAGEEVGMRSAPEGLPAGGGAGEVGREPDPPARGGLVSRIRCPVPRSGVAGPPDP